MTVQCEAATQVDGHIKSCMYTPPPLVAAGPDPLWVLFPLLLGTSACLEEPVVAGGFAGNRKSDIMIKSMRRQQKHRSTREI